MLRMQFKQAKRMDGIWLLLLCLVTFSGCGRGTNTSPSGVVSNNSQANELIGRWEFVIEKSQAGGLSYPTAIEIFSDGTASWETRTTFGPVEGRGTYQLSGVDRITLIGPGQNSNLDSIQTQYQYTLSGDELVLSDDSSHVFTFRRVGSN